MITYSWNTNDSYLHEQLHFVKFHTFVTLLYSSTVRAPVFGRHQIFGTSEHYGKAHEAYYLDEWIIITLHVAGFLHPAIFNTSITVLTNQVWKLLIALFKVPNTGAFTVHVLNFLCVYIFFDKLNTCRESIIHVTCKQFSSSSSYRRQLALAVCNFILLRPCDSDLSGNEGRCTQILDNQCALCKEKGT